MAKFTTTVTVNCPYCESESVIKYGKQNGKQLYKCKGCRKRFNDTGALHGRVVPADRIGVAIRMFYSGMSYKQIGENMADAFDMSEPDKATIYAWVRDYTDAAVKAMNGHKAHTSGKWVADEIAVDVGGEKMWNWNVMDSGTRYVLASHLSPTRTISNAIKVMEKARDAATEPPKQITTDRLWSYDKAIERVFPQARHVKSKGMKSIVSNNNLSERLQGTYRQRIKTLRGLENQRTAQRYLDGWALTYNLFREHESLGYEPPASVAGMDAPFREWADVVKREGRVSKPRSARAKRSPLRNVIFVPASKPKRKSRSRTAPIAR